MATTASPLSERLAIAQSRGRFDPAVVSRFERWLDTAPDEAVYRTSPLRYARDAGLDAGAAIDLFLHATHAGALDMSWGVLCPACASFLTTAGGLAGLSEKRTCNFCQVDCRCQLEDNIEVVFTVSPSVRRIRFHSLDSVDLRADALLLAMSPSSLARHPLRDLLSGAGLRVETLRGGEERAIEVAFAPGNYALVEPASHAALHFAVRDGGARRVAVDLFDGHMLPARATLDAAGATLGVRNRMKRGAHLGLYPDPIPPPEERPAGLCPPAIELDLPLRGKTLITRQAFRDLFKAQSIPSEAGLGLRSLAVLFTDLKSSTEMYERIGDLRAYDLVRRHFDVLQEAVAGRGGGVVKTIGDAIMAAFPAADDAMCAATAMRAAVPGVDPDERLALKIGVHAGPCIAVDLNERLDYFGRTVNIAARVQGAAGGDEIVCTRDVWSAAGVAEAAAAAGLEKQEQTLSLKGIEAPVPVVRLSGV